MDLHTYKEGHFKLVVATVLDTPSCILEIFAFFFLIKKNILI